MKRNRALPGTRPFLFASSVLGLFRTIDELADEVGAPKEPIDSTTRAQPDDLDPKILWKFGIYLILVLWAIVLVLYPLFAFFKYDRTGGRQPSKVLTYIPNLPPNPRNEHDPFIVLKNFRAREDAQLNSYRWVDRGKGIVSIPIERAMQIVARRGIPPVKAPANSREYWEPHQGSLLTGFEGKVEPEPK